MVRRLMLASVAVTALLGGAPALAQAPAPVTSPAPPPVAGTQGTRITSYDAAFFTQYAPRSALDIVQRLPGFTLDLGANNGNNGNGNNDIRGFAGVAGNVVINGQRPSTKSEALDAYLSRIPASRVKRVEVGPGDLFGADYSSKSQVANLILAEGSSGLAGNVVASGTRYFTHEIVPNASGTVSISRGPSTFNIAGDTRRGGQGEEGFDRVTDPATGDLIEFRRKFNDTHNYSPYISASWGLDKGPTNSANLNARYNFDHFILRQQNHVFPAGGEDRRDHLVLNYPTKILEIGGDVTRPFAGGALKFVGLINRRKRHTLDEYDTGNHDGSQVVGGFQQLSNSQRNESIGRLSWTRQNLLGFSFEAGAETAWNTLTDNLDLFVFDENGDKTRIDLPLDNAKVTELRGEVYANASRSLAKNLRMDIGVNYEASHLKVSGDTSADRKLRFLKPSITLDWQPGGGWHTQAILRRTVAQLDFYDFISAADLAAGRVNGGNAELQPQQAWEGRLVAEHPLFGQGKARLELGYNRINMLQDRVLVCDPNNPGVCLDAPGNIGTGKQMYADLTLDAPLDRLWKGLRVKLHGNIQQTRVRDPISGEQRDFSGFFPRWNWDADIRRDIGKFAYGFSLSDNRRITFFRTDEFDTNFNSGFPYTNAFIEYRPSSNKTLTLNLDDISNTAGARLRTFFDPNRTNAVPSANEYRFRNSHPRISLTFKQSFGGAGAAAKP